MFNLNLCCKIMEMNTVSHAVFNVKLEEITFQFSELLTLGPLSPLSPLPLLSPPNSATPFINDVTK